MIRTVFDVQCDSCGKPANLPKVAAWQARGAARDQGWETQGALAHDVCPDCIAKRADPSKGGSR